MFINGKPKPSLDAYRLPIWVISVKGSSASVWGQVRPGPHSKSQRVTIEWRSSHGGAWRTLSKLAVRQSQGYFTTRVRLPGTGGLRSVWRSPGGGTYYSRTAAAS
jgi:hypothetical protein